MGKYIQQADLENAAGVQMVVGCFDDNGDGVADPAPVAAVIARAEGLLDAFVSTEGLLPLLAPQDRLAIEVCTEYAVAFMFERRPEMARRYGDATLVVSSHYKRARELCNDIKDAQIDLPDNIATEIPANEGGIVYDNSTRMTIGGASGQINGGDF